MSVGITELAHALRARSAGEAVPINFGRSQQLLAAALGYKALASFEAAQAQNEEPANFDQVKYLVLDFDGLSKRAAGLNLATTATRLETLVRSAISDRLDSIRVYGSYEDFQEHIEEAIQDAVPDDERVTSAMATTNTDSIEEVYFEVDSIDFDGVAVGEDVVVPLDGHVGLHQDPERVFYGDKINVEGALTTTRLGQRLFAAMECEVFKAEVDHSWTSSDDEDDGPPVRSRSQALADELGLDLEEAASLADVEPQELDGNSGQMVYGYLLDFTDLAPPAVAAKIRRRYGSLQVRVAPDFFENVRGEDWPR
jgi:hypothetical protein